MKSLHEFITNAKPLTRSDIFEKTYERISEEDK